MVKMTNNGITIEVYPAEVDFYKHAGYVVVEEKKPEPEPEESEPEPMPKKPAARK